ncbi:MAG: hypothetical protein AB8H86_22055 [Polyangiales bacterium]
MLTVAFACSPPETPPQVVVSERSGGDEEPVESAEANSEGNPDDAACCVIGRLSEMVDVPTPCEVAYRRGAEMVEAVRAQDPNVPPPAPQALFESECARLPPSSQQCLIIDHAMEHLEECNAVLRSPEVQAFRAKIQRATRQP